MRYFIFLICVMGFFISGCNTHDKLEKDTQVPILTDTPTQTMTQSPTLSQTFPMATSSPTKSYFPTAIFTPLATNTYIATPTMPAVLDKTIGIFVVESIYFYGIDDRYYLHLEPNSVILVGNDLGPGYVLGGSYDILAMEKLDGELWLLIERFDGLQGWVDSSIGQIFFVLGTEEPESVLTPTLSQIEAMSTYQYELATVESQLLTATAMSPTPTPNPSIFTDCPTFEVDVDTINGTFDVDGIVLYYGGVYTYWNSAWILQFNNRVFLYHYNVGNRPVWECINSEWQMISKYDLPFRMEVPLWNPDYVYVFPK